jgi:hypothetical protein
MNDGCMASPPGTGKSFPPLAKGEVGGVGRDQAATSFAIGGGLGRDQATTSFAIGGGVSRDQATTSFAIGGGVARDQATTSFAMRESGHRLAARQAGINGKRSYNGVPQVHGCALRASESSNSHRVQTAVDSAIILSGEQRSWRPPSL